MKALTKKTKKKTPKKYTQQEIANRKREAASRADGQTAGVLWMCACPVHYSMPVKQLHREEVDGNGILQAPTPCPLCCLKQLMKDHGEMEVLNRRLDIELYHLKNKD